MRWLPWLGGFSRRSLLVRFRRVPGLRLFFCLKLFLPELEQLLHGRKPLPAPVVQLVLVLCKAGNSPALAPLGVLAVALHERPARRTLGFLPGGWLRMGHPYRGEQRDGCKNESHGTKPKKFALG